MSLILSIDTATETASIALSDESGVLEMMMNGQQKDHAAWIHHAIEQLMQKSGKRLNELNAVAVTAGPGSYTGLRVGMATAKGLCYVLKIPLITESTLKTMAQAAVEQLLKDSQITFDGLLCPMIDARRMEVFTAVYDVKLNEVLSPRPLVLTGQSFEELLEKQPVLFFGSGSSKLKETVQHINATCLDVRHDAGHLAQLAQAKFRVGDFTDAAYAEPVYLKEFYTHTKK
ncbi:MAG: tRNA (adenosine(37)-N6)-threonylcarbamoyltransferase complex dimerization subunit type 1 TsaB [Chitinophagaceae bacterium]